MRCHILNAVTKDLDLLILSILTLFAGPLLYQWMQNGGWIAKTFDRVIVAVLVVVVVFMLVPETLSGLGWSALLLMASGYLFPGLLETALKKSAHTFHLASLVLALVGLALHAALDGAGLAASAADESGQLALAIVLHRLGTGLVLWLIVQPVFGRKAAFALLVLVSVATVAGYLLSESLLPLAGRHAVLVIEALVIGAIVHSLVHRGHVERMV